MNIKEIIRYPYTGCTSEKYVAIVWEISCWGGLTVSNHCQVIPVAQAPIMPSTSELCRNRQEFEDCISRRGLVDKIYLPQIGMFQGA